MLEFCPKIQVFEFRRKIEFLNEILTFSLKSFGFLHFRILF